MDTVSMNMTLKEAEILVENDKATQQMQQSISKFASLLTCPLCDKVRYTNLKEHNVFTSGCELFWQRDK